MHALESLLDFITDDANNAEIGRAVAEREDRIRLVVARAARAGVVSELEPQRTVSEVDRAVAVVRVGLRQRDDRGSAKHIDGEIRSIHPELDRTFSEAG